MSLSSTFDLKGIDTGKVGNNKFVDYKLSDYRKDQGFNKRSTDALLGSLNLDRDFLKRVPRTTVMGKIDDFLFKNSRDYYLPTNVTERLAAADKVKTETENFDPYADLDKLLDYELKYKKAADTIDRKGRAVDDALQIASLQAQIPLYENLAKRTSTFKQQQLLDSKAIIQALPDAEEDRKRSSATRMAGTLKAVGDAYGRAVEGSVAVIRQPTATFSV